MNKRIFRKVAIGLELLIVPAIIFWAILEPSTFGSPKYGPHRHEGTWTGIGVAMMLLVLMPVVLFVLNHLVRYLFARLRPRTWREMDGMAKVLLIIEVALIVLVVGSWLVGGGDNPFTALAPFPIFGAVALLFMVFVDLMKFRSLE